MKSKFWTGLAMAAALSLSAGQAAAQAAPGDRPALIAKQDALFAQMFDEPDNLDLMFEYALTSIALQDYEAAISTLDRMLIFNPDLPNVRVELAASYYRIGSYPISKYYFRQVAQDPLASEELKARALEFIAAIEARTSPSALTGVVGVNGIFTTNANSGPDDREIEFLGVIVELTGNNVTAQTDVGGALSLSLNHKYDLGGANDDAWETNFAGYTQRYASTLAGAADVLFLRTGPRLSLDDDRYGPKLRPFAEFDHVRSSNSPLYTTIGAGFEYADTIDRFTTFRSQARLGWREFAGGPAKDGVNFKADGTLSYQMSASTTLTGMAMFELKGARDKSEQSYDFGLEGAASYRYDSGMDFASGPWQASASLRGMYRFYDQPGIANLNTRRQDVDLRIAVGNTAFIDNGLAVSVKANYFVRDSNIRNFDLDSLTVTAGVLMPF